MLSDRERATWDEMQDQLFAEDPVSVRAFDVPIQGLPGTPPESIAERRVHRILVWAAVALGTVLVAMVGIAQSLGRL